MLDIIVICGILRRKKGYIMNGVKLLRLKNEMGQREFAEYCGVSVHAVRRWESGKTPLGFLVMTKLQRLGTKVGMDVEEILK